MHLVHFDLSPYGSGRQDYEAVTGGRHVQVHRARSAGGLARAWALLAPTTAFRRGDTTYTVKQGHCEKSTGRFADAAFAMLAEPWIAQRAGPLAPLSLGVPRRALKRTGTAEVSGVPVTTYTFDTTEPLVSRRARVQGEVSLDAQGAPLASHGRVALAGGAKAKVPPLTWTFTSSHLHGHGNAVKLVLPDACRSARHNAATLDQLPMPKGAKKGMTLGGITSYRVPASAAKTRAFLRRALPAHGWHLEKSLSPQVLRIRRGKLRATLTLIPMGDGTQVGVMADE